MFWFFLPRRRLEGGDRGLLKLVRTGLLVLVVVTVVVVVRRRVVAVLLLVRGRQGGERSRLGQVLVDQKIASVPPDVQVLADLLLSRGVRRRRRIRRRHLMLVIFFKILLFEDDGAVARRAKRRIEQRLEAAGGAERVRVGALGQIGAAGRLQPKIGWRRVAERADAQVQVLVAVRVLVEIAVRVGAAFQPADHVGGDVLLVEWRRRRRRRSLVNGHADGEVDELVDGSGRLLAAFVAAADIYHVLRAFSGAAAAGLRIACRPLRCARPHRGRSLGAFSNWWRALR